MSNLKEQLKTLNGKIIVIKSNLYPGFYLDSHPSKIARFTECDTNDLGDAEWAKFIIHYVQDDIILLESLRFRSHYLDISTDYLGDAKVLNAYKYHKLQFTYQPEPPLNASWAQFKIEGNIDKFSIRSQRWADRLLKVNERGLDMIDHSDTFPFPTSIDDDSSFLVGSKKTVATEIKDRPDDYTYRMYFPASLTEVWQEIKSCPNITEHDFNLTYTYQVGLSHTNTTTKSISNSISIEMSKNSSVSIGLPGVGEAGAGGDIKVSNTLTVSLQEEISSTKEIVETTEISPTVGAGRTLKIYQKVVNYGDSYRFQSREVASVIIDTEAGKKWLADNASMIRKN